MFLPDMPSVKLVSIMGMYGGILLGIIPIVRIVRVIVPGIYISVVLTAVVILNGLIVMWSYRQYCPTVIGDWSIYEVERTGSHIGP
jgi:hypothetical protein